MPRADSESANRGPSATPHADAALGWLQQSGARSELLGEVSRQLQRRRRRRASGVVAAGLALGLAVVFWPRVPEVPAVDPVRIATTTALVTAPRQQVLADGTKVEFKEGAEIEVDFGGALRRVTLRRGEAHFQVAKDAARAFVVTAGTVEVRAVGTAFSVQLDHTAVEVLVTEGQVALEKVAPAPVSEPAPAAAALLDAGHHAVIPLAAEQPRINPVPVAEMHKRQAWRVPQLEFSRTPLGEILPLMNEHAAARGKRPIAIDPGSPGLRDVKLSGFLAADNTEGLAGLLRANFSVQVEMSESRITLRQGP